MRKETNSCLLSLYRELLLALHALSTTNLCAELGARLDRQTEEVEGHKLHKLPSSKVHKGHLQLQQQGDLGCVLAVHWKAAAYCCLILAQVMRRDSTGILESLSQAIPSNVTCCSAIFNWHPNNPGSNVHLPMNFFQLRGKWCKEGSD
jgi:hypothetical protein